MKAILAGGLTLLFAGVALAQPKEEPVASVDSLVGEVLINQGEDYVAPVDGLRLREGDQVLTKNDSSVVVRYDDDCDVKVEENTVYTVDEPEDCAVVALGESAAVAGSSTAGLSGSTGRFLIAGVGIIGVIAIFADGGSDKPDRVVSP